MTASAPGWAVRPARPSDRPACVDVAVRAFENDPGHRYFFPDPDRYYEQASAFHRYLFSARLAVGAVFVAAPAGSGPLAVSVWERPAGSGTNADWSPAEHWEAAAAVMGRETAERVGAYGELIHARLPSEAHWYLGVLATHPDRQGQGLGRAVIEPIRRQADQDETPIVLETSTAANRDLYRHLGFAVLDYFEVEGVLPVWMMRRPPGAGAWR